MERSPTSSAWLPKKTFTGSSITFSGHFLQCEQSQISNLLSEAGAVAAWLQSNGPKKLLSYSPQLSNFVNQYLNLGNAMSAGEAGELLVAAEAGLALQDWLLLVAAVGLTAYVLYGGIYCVGQAFGQQN